MRLLGQLECEEQARKLAAWLLTLGIETKVEPPEPEEAQTEIWVKDEDRLDQAKEELQNFLRQPNDARYANAVAQAETIAKREQQRRARIQKNIVKVQPSQNSSRSPLTILLIVICGVVVLLTDFGEPPRDKAVYRALQFVAVGPPASERLVEIAANDPDDLRVRLASLQRGELWRLVTPIFIHYGAFHILFNMLWLYQFGRMIEMRYGTPSLGVLVLGTAAISNFFQCTVPVAIGGLTPGFVGGVLITALGGMSGVVYGLFGFIWIRSIFDRSSGFYLPQSTIVILIGWLFFCMLPTSTQLTGSFTANWAHAVGLVVGMIAGYWPVLTGKSA